MGDPASAAAHLQKAPSDRAIPAANDKRQYPRFKVEGATAILGKPGFLQNLGLLSAARPVINLSQGGAMIRLGKRLPIESRHDLRIEILKCREVIEATAEIRWCLASAKKESDIYVGVSFVELSDAERRKLIRMQELFLSAEYKALAQARKD